MKVHLNPIQLDRMDRWFIISATQESVGDWDHPTNLAATDRLNRLLEAARTPFLRASGVYRGVNQGASFLVHGSEEWGRRLARAFNQESILTRRGLVSASGDVLAGWDGLILGDAAREEEFYSEVGGTAFSVKLRWPQPEPAPKGEERQWPEKPAPQYCDDFSCVSFQPEHKLRSYWEQAAADFPADPHALLRHVEQVLLDWAPNIDEVADYQAWHKLRRGLEAAAKHRVRG